MLLTPLSTNNSVDRVMSPNQTSALRLLSSHKFPLLKTIQPFKPGLGLGSQARSLGLNYNCGCCGAVGMGAAPWPCAMAELATINIMEDAPVTFAPNFQLGTIADCALTPATKLAIATSSTDNNSSLALAQPGPSTSDN